MASLDEALGEITGFLARHPPFSALSREALERLVRRGEIEFFSAGSDILAQAGVPSRYFYVVRRGSVELLDAGEVVDVLDEGEAFGHPSLLSGLPPAFTVRAREDCLCYLFPAEPTLAALSDPAGLTFLATTLEDRLERASARSRRGFSLGTARVGALASPVPVIPSPAVPIQEVAAQMTEKRASSAVVIDGDAFGIVTDTDLRARVVARSLPPDAPAATVMSASALTAPPERLAFDALVDMLEAEIHHLLVIDAEGRLLGVVTHAALLNLDSPSPFTLRQEITRAEDVAALAKALDALPQVVVKLLDGGVEPVDLGDVIATTSDAVVRRVLELAVLELGDPPCSWAWLALGSEARREQTLATDQDNGLAYDGPEDEVEGYFAVLAERVNGAIADCGFKACRAGVMARNRPWRRTRASWMELFDTSLRFPDRERVFLATIAFDLRRVAGPLRLEEEVADLLATAPERPAFLTRLRRRALDFRPPTGFLRDFVVERSGERVGTLDIKRGGVMPIVDIARLYALAAGSSTVGTLDRLRAAGARGSLEGIRATELSEAFATVTRIRLEHQAAQVERGHPPDNRINPRELPPLARRELKESFRAIAQVQKALEPRVPTRLG
ncbi:MAG: putative nucleotidyltransferase substrate binding domain-containing protein [Gaiellaceae bacterium]